MEEPIQNTIEIPKSPQEFIDAYNKLCDEYGLKLTASPSFIARDDNTWSIVIKWGIGKTKP